MFHVFGIWVGMIVLGGGVEVQVRTLDGEVHSGVLAGLSEQNVHLQTGSGPVSAPLDRVVELAVKTPPAAKTSAPLWVQLVDGSGTPAQQFLLEEGKVQLQPGGAASTLRCLRRDIGWVRFQPETETLAPTWKRLLESKTDTDLLVLRTDQGLDYHRGIIHQVSGETVQFELDRERIPVKRARIFGLVFRHPEGRSLPAAMGVLQDANGGKWHVQKLVLEGESLRWTTPTGLEGVTPLTELVRVDFSEGKIVYLSDLEAESVRWTPFFGTGEVPSSQAEFFSPRKDRALDPRPIRLGGKQYAKGLAIHSRTEMVYRLPRPFRRLQAVVGIDDQIRPQGHVQLIIRGDDKVLLDQAISGAQPPQQIDLDVSNVRRLVILVDFGHDADIGDHLLLGDIKLVQ